MHMHSMLYRRFPTTHTERNGVTIHADSLDYVVKLAICNYPLDLYARIRQGVGSYVGGVRAFGRVSSNRDSEYNAYLISAQSMLPR